MSLEYQNEVSAGSDETASETARVPFPLYTGILLACIAVVSVAQWIFGLNESILAAGFDKPRFLERHEYWRLLTGAALHGGPLHVVMNGYALYMFGKLIELLSNRAHLAIVFLLAAIGGSFLSLIFNPAGTSVGASGGIIGLLGYVAVYAFRRRDFISPEFRRSLVFNIGFIFVYGLLLYNVIDNFGHFGGLITGGVYAFLQIPTDPYIDPRTVRPITRYMGVATLAVFVATSVLSVLLLARFR